MQTPPFLFEFSSLLFFLIPMTIMIFLYVAMGLRIRRPAAFGKNTAVHADKTKQAQSKKAILKMLGKLLYNTILQGGLRLVCLSKSKQKRRVLYYYVVVCNWYNNFIDTIAILLYFLTVRKIIRFDFAHELKIGGLRYTLCTTWITIKLQLSGRISYLTNSSPKRTVLE